MSFIDEATIKIEGGTGGDGCSSFRREKFVPLGGPDGGNGGKGGDVIFIASESKRSLLDFKFQPLYQAERGQHGKGKDMHGRGGEDLIISVPVGTLLYEKGELLADLNKNNQQICIAKGGRGGRGNMTYTTSTNRAPRTFQRGTPGEVREVKLELRLLADVGLIGFPNAGKSSFLKAVSRAEPKVAAYPFTTLDPNLGVVKHKQQNLVLADLPGLIEGAHKGTGLGHKFLKHASRNRILLHLVEAWVEPEEIIERVGVIRHELNAHDPALSLRKEILVFTKCDLMTPEQVEERRRELLLFDLDGIFISSHSKLGVEDLLDQVIYSLKEAKENEVEQTSEEQNAPEPEISALEHSLPS